MTDRSLISSDRFFFAPKLDDGFAPVVLQAWTLCYEMFFYAIFAVALILPRRFRLAALAGALVAILAGRSLIHGYVAVYLSPLMLEFAAGVAIGAVWASERQVAASVAVAMLIVGCAWLVVAPEPADEVQRVIQWGLPSTLVVAGIVLIERDTGLPYIRWMHFLGDASYSIYLWQVIAIVFVTVPLTRLGVPNAVMPSLVIPGATCVALIAYWYVERRLSLLFEPERTRISG